MKRTRILALTAGATLAAGLAVSVPAHASDNYPGINPIHHASDNHMRQAGDNYPGAKSLTPTNTGISWGRM